MDKAQVKELLYQALETEIGGSKIYKTALRCVQNSELRQEWKEYLEQTENHVRIVQEVFERLSLDPDLDTPGRQVVRHKGKAMIEAMEMALKSGPPAAAELVAAECVVEAETKDHQNWELIGTIAEHMTGNEGKLLGRLTRKLRKKRTSICITPPDGPESSGSNRSDYRRLFRLQRKRRT